MDRGVTVDQYVAKGNDLPQGCDGLDGGGVQFLRLCQGFADRDEFPLDAGPEQCVPLIVRERLAAREIVQEPARNQNVVQTLGNFRIHRPSDGCDGSSAGNKGSARRALLRGLLCALTSLRERTISQNRLVSDRLEPSAGNPPEDPSRFGQAGSSRPQLSRTTPTFGRGGAGTGLPAPVCAAQ